MTNFDYDVRDRANVARSARCKKASVRGPRGCSLPSDHLTAAQKRKLNGPVESYRLDRPMTLTAFDSMPDDLQKEYLLRLQTNFKATDTMICEMFGVTNTPVLLRRKRLGVPSLGKGARPSEETVRTWRDWLWGAGEDVAETETAAEIEQVEEQDYVDSPVEDICLNDTEAEAETAVEADASVEGDTEDATIPAPVRMNEFVLELTGKFSPSKLAGLLEFLPVSDEAITIRIEVKKA